MLPLDSNMKAAKLWDSVLHLISKRGGVLGEAVVRDLQSHKARYEERENSVKEIKKNAERNRKSRLPL